MTQIEWSRYGNKQDPEDMPVDGLIDLRGLIDRVRHAVDPHVGSEYDIQVEFKVVLKGGPSRDWDFGEGKVTI